MALNGPTALAWDEVLFLHLETGGGWSPPPLVMHKGHMRRVHQSDHSVIHMGVEIFLNEQGTFSKQTPENLAALTGWWNTIHAVDIDKDGDMDFVVGNHGLNSRFKASSTEPISLFVKDFDF